MKEDFLKAFKRTFPCLFTYVFLGIAFGISLSKVGQGWLYSLLSSVFVFGGSIQLMMINFIADMTPIYVVIIVTIAVNARYAFYGVSFLNKFKDYEWYRKWYLIYTLSDEAYSIMVATSLPFKRDSRRYDFFICFQNHCYWTFGCVLGSILASFITKVDAIQGLDFIMTALFTCIFVEQLQTNKTQTPAVIGTLSAILSLLVCNLIGFKYFILPSLAVTITMLFVLRKRITRKGGFQE